jgi:hypothetical protein
MEGWCSPEGYAPVRGPDPAAGSERTRDCGIDDTTQEERQVNLRAISWTGVTGASVQGACATRTPQGDCELKSLR